MIKSEKENFIGYFQKTSLMSFSLKALGLILTFILQILITNNLTVEIVGTYTFLISLSAIIINISVLGLNKASLKIIPENISKKNMKNLTGFFSFSIKAILLSSLILSFVVFIFLYLFNNEQFQYLNANILINVSLISIIGTLTLFYTGFFQGLKKPIVAQLPDLIFKPLIIIIVIFFLRERFDLDTLFLVNFYATTFALLYFFSLKIPFSSKVSLNDRLASKVKLDWLRLGLGFQAITVCNVFIVQTPILMLGFLSNESSVAIYAIASKVANLLTLFLVSANTVVAPLVSELYSKKNFYELNKLMQSVSRFVSILTVLSAMIIIFMSEEILSLFGSEYMQGKIILYILCLSCLFNSLTGGVSYLLSLSGKQNIVIKILFLCSFLSIVLNYFLISIYGIIGAALSVLLITTLWNVLMFIYVVRNMGINTTFFKIGAKYET